MPESFVKYRNGVHEATEQRHALVLYPQHIDDQLLWDACRSGDEKAFITIFNRFASPMFNYGCRITPEEELVKDAVQDLFIEIWQNKARLGATTSLKFYLFKSLRRKISRMKGGALARVFTTDPPPDLAVSPSHEFVLISEQISAEKKQKLMAMLKTLTRRQHEAIFLRYFEELSCEQIAGVMDLSRQAVYNLLHQALDELRKCASASGDHHV